MSVQITREEIVSRLIGVFREVFEDDALEVAEKMTADDIPEWDSLKHIMLVLAIETEFGVKLKASEIGAIANVGALVALLEAKIA